MKKYVKQVMDAVRKYIDEEMKNAPEEKTREVLAEFETKIHHADRLYCCRHTSRMPFPWTYDRICHALLLPREQRAADVSHER